MNTLETLSQARLSRRTFLKGVFAVGGAVVGEEVARQIAPLKALAQDICTPRNDGSGLVNCVGTGPSTGTNQATSQENNYQQPASSFGDTEVLSNPAPKNQAQSVDTGAGDNVVYYADPAVTPPNSNRQWSPPGSFGHIGGEVEDIFVGSGGGQTTSMRSDRERFVSCTQDTGGVVWKWLGPNQRFDASCAVTGKVR